MKFASLNHNSVLYLLGALAVSLIANSVQAQPNHKCFSGQASWYGSELHGHKTACGERFNKNTLTAAHRSLPFGTKILVKNCRTGHSCVVEVRDRGPHIAGRVIDVSRHAAERLHLISCGVGKVECKVLDEKTAAEIDTSHLIAASAAEKPEAK